MNPKKISENKTPTCTIAFTASVRHGISGVIILLRVENFPATEYIIPKEELVRIAGNRARFQIRVPLVEPRIVHAWRKWNLMKFRGFDYFINKTKGSS